VTPARRFEFGHEPARPRAAPRPASSAEDKTVPLPLLDAPAAPTWDGRPTQPLAEAAAPVAPVLPFSARATPVVAPPVVPIAAPRRRRIGTWLATGTVSLALYTAAVIAIVSPRRVVEAPVSTAPTAAAPAPTIEPVPSTAPAPQASASPPAPVAPPPRPAPARVARPPAPTRTSQPVSDVRNPWSYD
jgi:hypothetical protein